MSIRVYVVPEKRRGVLLLRWRIPGTKIWKQKAAGTKDARQAAKLAAQLEADLEQGRFELPSKVTWADFRQRYEDEKLASLSDKTAKSAATALNHVERYIRPDKLADVSSSALSVLQAKLRQRGIAEASIACQLRHVRAALGWAHSLGMLPKLPKIEMPKRAKGSKLMKGRPITGEEFDRMLAVVPKVRPTDADAWTRLLRGLWLSGLRLGEALDLSWELDAKFSIDLTGKHPRFRILAAGQKSNTDQLLPMTPDFAAWLLATPEAERLGLVFPIASRRHGATPLLYWVSNVITAMGEAAGVKVSTRKQRPSKKRDAKAADEVTKFASAHDLRRAFGTRWAGRVNSATLKLLMRHSDTATTERYYVAMDADDVAATLWRDHGSVAVQSASSCGQSADLCGHSCGVEEKSNAYSASRDSQVLF